MIKSITFTGEKGYITEEKHLSYLIGKKFEFVPDKINILFGENGSGKTTILKALGGYCLTTDGWTNPYMFEPLDIFPLFDDLSKEDEQKALEDKIFKTMGNKADIEWDGIPVYYHNFEKRLLNSTGHFGDLGGSVFRSSMDELRFHLNKNNISNGEMSIDIFSKVVGNLKRAITLDDLYEGYDKKIAYLNDRWQNCYRIQKEYLYSKLSSDITDSTNTILLDEIDKSNSITNVLVLFMKILPALRKKKKLQIIAVSHSPIVLSNLVYGDKKNYNVISMNEEYTEQTINLLKGIKF